MKVYCFEIIEERWIVADSLPSASLVAIEPSEHYDSRLLSVQLKHEMDYEG